MESSRTMGPPGGKRSPRTEERTAEASTTALVDVADTATGIPDPLPVVG